MNDNGSKVVPLKRPQGTSPPPVAARVIALEDLLAEAKAGQLRGLGFAAVYDQTASDRMQAVTSGIFTDGDPSVSADMVVGLSLASRYAIDAIYLE